MTKLNVEKGKQGFQKTVKAEPVTEANLEQVRAENERVRVSQGPIRYRNISDIAHDFPVTSDDLKDVLHEMSKRVSRDKVAELQIEQVLVAREIAEQFPDVAVVEFQIDGDDEFWQVSAPRSLDVNGDPLDDEEYPPDVDSDMEELLDDRLSSLAKETIRDDGYDHLSEKYAELNIAELNQMWR